MGDQITARRRRALHFLADGVGMSRREHDPFAVQIFGKAFVGIVFGGVRPAGDYLAVFLGQRNIILGLGRRDKVRSLRTDLSKGEIGPLHMRTVDAADRFAEDLMKKLIYISAAEGRTPNNQFIFMLRNNIQYFERTKGRIDQSKLNAIDLSEYYSDTDPNERKE